MPVFEAAVANPAKFWRLVYGNRRGRAEPMPHVGRFEGGASSSNKSRSPLLRPIGYPTVMKAPAFSASSTPLPRDQSQVALRTFTSRSESAWANALAFVSTASRAAPGSSWSSARITAWTSPRSGRALRQLATPAIPRHGYPMGVTANPHLRLEIGDPV